MIEEEAALHRKAISHCDILICYRLPLRRILMLDALSEVRSIYMREVIVAHEGIDSRKRALL
ncbi:MAG: hypothetical protein QXJ68_04840 [Methanocellales archaeon]